MKITFSVHMNLSQKSLLFGVEEKKTIKKFNFFPTKYEGALELKLWLFISDKKAKTWLNIMNERYKRVFNCSFIFTFIIIRTRAIFFLSKNGRRKSYIFVYIFYIGDHEYVRLFPHFYYGDLENVFR